MNYKMDKLSHNNKNTWNFWLNELEIKYLSLSNKWKLISTNIHVSIFILMTDDICPKIINWLGQNYR